MPFIKVVKESTVGPCDAKKKFKTGFNPIVVKERLDSIVEMNLPIWGTEFDVNSPDENMRADELETFYRIAFNPPSVGGILMWGSWENSHWRQNCKIVNADWTLNAAGRGYQSLIEKWTTRGSETTDSRGNADFQCFYGKYRVTLTPENGEPIVTTIECLPDGIGQFVIDLSTTAAVSK